MLQLAVTPGEPAGIGAELLVRYVQRPLQGLSLVAVCDPTLLQDTARALELPLDIAAFQPGMPAREAGDGRLSVCGVAMAAAVEPGQLNRANARYVLDTLARASDGCRDGTFQALITGPVHKGIINDAGFAFSGHTEFFAERAGVARVVMMLATDGLRVALATTHLPLKDVSAAITHHELTETLRILERDLRQKFAIAQPRILICGLNPHAGEGGHLGQEEQQVITPVIEALRSEGMQLIGPLPADTLFTPKYLDAADAVLAMYHDQGLPVLKYKGFGRAVNITLGLPFVRTSVDHGTALDLAGKGVADLGSFATAVDTAAVMLKVQARA